MKRLILILAACLLAPMVHAGAQTDYVQGALTNVSTVATNGAVVTTNTSPVVDGYVDAIYVDLSGYASPTCTVNLVTSGATPSRTIYSASVTADGWIYPRAAPVNTAGSAISGAETRIPLIRDAIKSYNTAANETGVFARVWVLITDMP